MKKAITSLATVLFAITSLYAPSAFPRRADHSTAPRITDLACALIAPGLYRLSFHATPDAGLIQVFASGSPSHIDSPKPIVTLTQSPAEVSVPENFGRVYFHLRPASGPTRVVSLRRLPLEGAANFRDLGGYRTSDGHYVRWGLVYRSGHLANLTANDYKYLNSLQLRLICDVRTETERQRSPTRWIGSPPEFLSAPIGQNHDGTLSPEEVANKVAAATSPNSTASHAYEQYAFEYAPQFGNILRRLAHGDLPAVEHCTSGKDRTGLFSAFLLTILGVPRETVLQDYLLTGPYTLDPQSLAKTSADLQRISGATQPLDDASVRAIMTPDAATLIDTFDSINKKYGSFDNYRRKALHISDSDAAALRRRLLQP